MLLLNNLHFHVIYIESDQIKHFQRTQDDEKRHLHLY